MVRIALIGCGGHAMASHAASLAHYAGQHTGRIALAAACDLDLGRARAACERFGFAAAYDSIDRLLDAEKLDGAICVMPVEAIAATATLLLERGLPCTIEKPLGTSLAQAHELATTARRTGTPHMVSVDRRFNPWLRRAVEVCRRRGPIRYVLASMIRPRRREGAFVTSTAIHAVDAMRHVAGEVERFDVVARDEPEMTSRWFHVDFVFRGARRGRLDIMPTAGMCEERYELYGDGFRAVVSIPIGSGAGLRCWQDGRTVVADQTPPETPQFITCGAYDETAHFVRGLCDGALGPAVWDVLPSSEICHQIDRLAPQAGAPGADGS